MTLSALGHRVQVANISDVYLAPSSRAVWNQFDELGLLLGVQRLTEEKNWEYKRRLFDTYTHRANSTYQGLINGISRELGCPLYTPVVIYPRRDPGTGLYLATDPYIKIDGASVYLYVDHTNDVVEYRIDRFEKANFDKLGWLVDQINSCTYFGAVLTDEDYYYKNSMVLLNQSNRTEVFEPIRQSTKFKLAYMNIVPGTVTFQYGPGVFAREVPLEASVVSSGQYWIDYVNGIVCCYSMPNVGTVVRYEYVTDQWKPLASDIIIHDINSENFKTKLFEQILQDDGTYAHGLPTELGTDLINELLAVSPQYWGI